MRRLTSAVLVALAFGSVAAVPAASAATDHQYQAWTSKAVAEFSNCSPAAAVGQHCDAWAVTATTITDPDGTKSLLVVAQYGIDITTAGPVRKLFGSGSAKTTVSVDSKLVKAAAKATVSMLGGCTATGCVRSSLVVDVKWVGTGTIATNAGRTVNQIANCRVENSWDTKTRAATVSGKIGASAFVTSSIPAVLSVYHEENGTICV